MNKKTAMAAAALALFLLSLIAPPAADARRGKRRLSKRAVHVEAGETRRRDITTRGPVVVDGIVHADVTVSGGSVTIRGEVNGDVVALGGNVIVTGKIIGDLVALGGDIELDGTVTNDIVSIGGSVVLKSLAIVMGDVTVLGGELDHQEGAAVNGEKVNFNLGNLGMFPTILSKLIGRSILEYIVFVISLAGLGAILMLMTLFIGEPVGRVAKTVKKDIWRAAGYGLLVGVAFIPALVLLAISIIGIPVIPLAFLMLFAAVLMSLASFSLLLSERLFDALKRPMPSRPLCVGAGFVLLNVLFIAGKLLTLGDGGPLSVLGVIFILTNMMLISVGIMLGMGGVVLTRFGTQDQTPAAPAASLPAPEDPVL